MRNTNEIIEDLGVCADAGGCDGCGFKIDMGGACITYLLLAARRRLGGDAGPVRTVRRGDYGAAAAAGGGAA